MTYQCSQVIEKVFGRFCKEVGIPEDKRPIVNMKNE
jgi:hypothetical protein